MDNKATFYKDRSGEIWFLGIYSNNFEDVEKEILSWSAHEEYAKWLRDTGVKPPIIAMHQPQFETLLHAVHYMALEAGKFTPQEFNDNLLGLYKGTAIAQTHAVIPLNGFMLVIGKVFDHKRKVAEKLMARSESWGMSHGFIPLEKDGNIFTKYRSFEFTVGPLVFAANKVTAISLINKVEDITTMADIKSLSDEDRQLIADLLGDTDVEGASEQARSILVRALASAKMLDEKQEVPEDEETPEEEDDEEAEEEKLVEVETTEYAKFRTQIMADLQVDALQASFKQMGDLLTAAQQKIAELEAQVAKMQQTDDEKIASQFTTPDWTLGFGRKQAVEDEKLLDDLKERIPDKLDGIEEKAGPLSQGFWNFLKVSQ